MFFQKTQQKNKPIESIKRVLILLGFFIKKKSHQWCIWFFLTSEWFHCSQQYAVCIKPCTCRLCENKKVRKVSDSKVRETMPCLSESVYDQCENIYPWAEMFSGTQKSEESSSGLWFFKVTLSLLAFSKGSLNEQDWVTQAPIPRLFLFIFLGRAASRSIFSRMAFYFQVTTS